MKATGIVRRIDELGRIVIPKELRRTLHLREGEPLEIFTEQDGALILKKYSPIEELSEPAGRFCEAVFASTGLMCAVCDRDRFIAAAGAGRKELLGRAVSAPLAQAMLQRESLRAGAEPIRPTEGSPLGILSAAPIFSEGDVRGAAVLLSARTESASPLAETLASLGAQLLGREADS